MAYQLEPCDRPGCIKVHKVVSVKRHHAKYEGPETSPLRDSDEDPASAPPAGSSPEPLTRL
jgi:hypothetical protein